MWLYIFLRGQQLSQLYTHVQMVVQPDLERRVFCISAVFSFLFLLQQVFLIGNFR
jgi:hypothetical protein